jgi:hypothetical protein
MWDDVWETGMPNIPQSTTGAIKLVPLTLGLVAGAATTTALRHALVEPKRADELAAQGIQTIDSRQASVYAMAAPFGIAAGIGLGLKSRSPTAGMTTATQIATAALLSTVAGAAINADSSKAEDYVLGIGAMAALTGGGILMGVREQFSHGGVRLAGLGLFGMAIGAAVPMMASAAGGMPDRLRNGVVHREQ